MPTFGKGATEHFVSAKKLRPIQRVSVPSLRVLMVLSGDEDEPEPLLTRAKLLERAGYTPQSGIVTRCLNGVREGSSSGPPKPGLLEMGYVKEVILNTEEVKEVTYKITLAGRKFLQEFIRQSDGLPEMRDKTMCINKRYKGNAP